MENPLCISSSIETIMFFANPVRIIKQPFLLASIVRLYDKQLILQESIVFRTFHQGNTVHGGRTLDFEKVASSGG